MDDTANNEAAIRSLVESIKARRVILFTGAGTSRRSGCPLWVELIEILRRRMQATLGDQHSSRDYEVNDLLWQAQRIRKWSGWKATLDEVFAGKEPTPFHKRLVEIPFHRVFTVNYDLLLEKASRGPQPDRWLESLHYHESEQVEKFIRKFHSVSTAENGNVVFHLHGSLRDWGQAIFAEEDYRKFYVDENPIRNLLWMTVATYSVLFVGFGLTDWDFLSIFRVVRHKMGNEKPCHFAILPNDNKEDCTTKRNYLNDKYGIEPIFYPLENRVIAGSRPRIVPDYEKHLDPLVNRLSNEVDASLSAYAPHQLPDSFFDWIETQQGMERPQTTGSPSALTLEKKTEEFLQGDS